MASGSPERRQRDLATLFRAGTAVGLTDGELLARIERGAAEDSALLFEILVTRHGPMVSRVCRNVLNDPADADDAFQATFLVLAQRFRTIRDRDSIGGWLYGVAARVSARARREAARRRKKERVNVRLAVISPPTDEACRSLAVQEEVRRLPERYRSVVVLCYWEGLTHEQAAARLACPLGTVRSRMARARELLRRRLVRRGFEPDLSGDGVAGAVVPLSAGLTRHTVEIASHLASGRGVSRVVASRVATLSSQVARRMVVMKLGILAAPVCLVLAGPIGLGVGARTLKQPEAAGGGKPVIRNVGSTPRRTPPKPDMRSYIVEPPDLLRVEVLEALPGRPISGEKLVRPDGMLSLGFYGELSVTGFTVRQIKGQIVNHLRKYLTDEALGLQEVDPLTGEIQRMIGPEFTDRVSVEVTAFNSKQVYVLGDVRHPGKVPVVGEARVLDALDFAGGLNETADRNRVLLVRHDHRGRPTLPLPIRIDDIRSGRDASSDYVLRPGDRLIVMRDREFQGEKLAPSEEELVAAEPVRENVDGGVVARPAERGVAGRVERLERRLDEVEARLREVLERLDRPR